MTDIHVETPQTIPGPACETCSSPTRMFGIEPHPRLPHTDVHTYVCDACDVSQVLIVPLAGPRKRA